MIRGISQVLGADGAEGADGRQRAALSAIQFVDPFTYANQLAILTAGRSRQRVPTSCGSPDFYTQVAVARGPCGADRMIGGGW